jgi:uncharacterized protein (TIGR01777 family)
MKTVLLTGGSGLIGTRLRKLLETEGFATRTLTRTKPPRPDAFYWDPAKNELDINALDDVSAIIHLAGASIGSGFWTRRKKQLIASSRIDSTRLLAEAIRRRGLRPEVFVSASAIGIYGDSGDRWVDESSPADSGFLGSTCVAWEAEAAGISSLGVRTVILRTGLVLSADGGLLPAVRLPVMWGLGAALGSGRQYQSWIHIDDLCRMYLMALRTPSLHGVYNAVAPHPVTQQDFMKAVADVANRPLWLPKIPSALLRLALGEKSELVLTGQRVSAKKIVAAGFAFRHPDLREALKSIYP